MSEAIDTSTEPSCNYYGSTEVAGQRRSPGLIVSLPALMRALSGLRGTLRRHRVSRIVIEPIVPQSLLGLLATLDPIEEEFPIIEELPQTPVEL